MLHLLLPCCVHRYTLDGSLTLPEAFAYEACRIFRDRLVGEAVETFNSMLAAVLNAHLGFRCAWGGRLWHYCEASVRRATEAISGTITTLTSTLMSLCT